MKPCAIFEGETLHQYAEYWLLSPKSGWMSSEGSNFPHLAACVLQSWLGLGTSVCAFVFALGWAWLTGALLGLKVKFVESSLFSYTNSRLTHGRVLEVVIR